VSPTQLAECWEAFSLNKNVKTLDDHSFAAFRTQLIKTCNNNEVLDDVVVDDSAVLRVTNKKHDTPSAVVTPAHNKRHQIDHGSRDENPSSSNRRVSMSPNAQITTNNPPTTLASYEHRKGSGTVVAEYNPHQLPSAAVSSELARPRCRVWHDFATNVKEPYRHYFTVIEERAVALDNMLQEKYEQFSEQYQFGSEQLAGLEAVNIPRQDKICCIGRICNSVR
jgi:hypothetical protein